MVAVSKTKPTRFALNTFIGLNYLPIAKKKVDPGRKKERKTIKLK